MSGKKKLIFFGVAGVAMLALFCLVRSRHSVSVVKPALPAKAPPENVNVVTQAVARITNAVKTFEPDKNWDWTNQVPLAQRAEAIDRVKKIAQVVSVANVPVVFYGRVFDQNNEPVADVHVQALVSKWTVVGLAQRRSQMVTNLFSSDAIGMFTIRGMDGEWLSLSLQKDGYELAPGNLGGYGYGPGVSVHHEPNLSNPVIYRMWKRQGAAELVSQGFEKKVRADGTPISLDLSSGQFTIGADKFPGPTVRVWRDPLNFDYQTSLPDLWRYELIWPGGKLLPTDDVFCYLAPTTGYVEKIETTIRKGEPNYRFRDKRFFYFTNNQGQYGRGSLEIWADRVGEAAEVTLSVSWNPDGSRNLEAKAQ